MGETEAIAVQRGFWNQRAKTFSHTGWGNFLKYAFDQPARLKAIAAILDAHAPRGDAAFDYGCGSGDFSALLATRYRTVTAYDISDEVIRIARQAHLPASGITFSSDPACLETSISDGSLDLVLSVTVLGHILDDDELVRQLEMIRRKLKPGGKLIAFEYSLPSKVGASDYQRFSTFVEWKSLFGRAGFSLECDYGFYHPDRRPTLSYLLYRFHPAKWYWSIFLDQESAHARIRALAQRRVERSRDLFWPGRPSDWMRIMVLKKVQGHG